MTDETHSHGREGGCSRREFLRRAGLAGATAAGVLAAGFALHNRVARRPDEEVRLKDYRVPADSRPRVVAAKGDHVERMLRDCLDPMGGIARFVKSGDVVLLKPNIGFASPPGIGATTNPEVVAATARLCLLAGAAAVWVTDNPINDPERCMTVSGIAAAARAAGARIFLPRPDAFRTVVEPANQRLARWSFLYGPFRNVTVVIGIPVVKNHSLAGATLGMKNWYGLLGGPRNQLHQDTHTSIADLATLVKPTFTILDATRVMFRNGPTGGSPGDVRPERTLAVGVDPVALDVFGASLLGMSHHELPSLAEAARRGLGVLDPRDAGFEMLPGARVGGLQ